MQLNLKEQRRRVMAARTALVLDEPFFGTLALRLKLVEEAPCGCPDPSASSCPHTAWTDGQSLGYFPSFVATLNDPQLQSLIVHEVMHCAGGHPWRRDLRDAAKWNEACDRSINPTLRDAGYTLPPDGMFELDPSHKGKSAEWIFDRLPTKPPEEQATGGQGKGPPKPGQGQSAGQGAGTPAGGPSKPSNKGVNKPSNQAVNSPSPAAGTPSGRSSGKNDPSANGTPSQSGGPTPKRSSLGEVRDSPPTAEGSDEAPATESDWQQAVQQAAVLAKGQGKLPGELKRFAKTAAESRIDWRSATRRFAQERCASDYSFARPNPRYVASRIYLPALRNYEVGDMLVGIDVSGSVDDVLLGQFEKEMQAIADEVKPRRMIVMYCDARVHRTDIFERGDVIKLTSCGGGGTDFRPVFEAALALDEPPVCITYLTDLLGTFPDEDPGIPTLWVTGTNDARPVPFGELVAAA